MRHLEFARAGGAFDGLPWGYLGADGYRRALEECW